MKCSHLMNVCYFALDSLILIINPNNLQFATRVCCHISNTFVIKYWFVVNNGIQLHNMHFRDRTYVHNTSDIPYLSSVCVSFILRCYVLLHVLHFLIMIYCKLYPRTFAIFLQMMNWCVGFVIWLNFNYF